MQCPNCGYEADDIAFFCPQCRFQFRQTGDIPDADTMVPDIPARHSVIDENIFEENPQKFSEKELRLLEVQLIQPAVLVVLIISLFTYSLVSEVPFIPVSVAGLTIGVTGIVCLTFGLLAGMIFFLLCRRSLL